MSETLQDWRHIWLYAKGHYARSGDLLSDLKVLVGHHSAIKPEHVTEGDILIVMCEIAHPYLMTGNAESKLREFLANLIRISQEKKTPLSVADVANRLLVALSLVRTRYGGEEVIKLGEPDYNLLPAPAK